VTVVSDTSPVNYLIEIQCIHVLENLFGGIVLPEAVIAELRVPGAPPAVKHGLAHSLDGLTVENCKSDPALNHLDPGEREAISVAETLHADLVLIDERQARSTARQRGLPFMGTIGVLGLAARRSLINPAEAVDRLEKTTFRVAPELLEALLLDAPEE
jgi:predicted nucleic acid-binding protein